MPRPEAARRPRALSIAGSDPSGGAGLQTDLKTFAAWGCYGMAAPTALTAQDTTRVHAVHVPPAEFLGRCLDALLEDCPPDAAKTGMLPTAETVAVVADRWGRAGAAPLVVDPVLVATSGDALAGDGVAEALVRRLLPLAAVVTPNADEAAALARTTVRSEADAWDAARRLAGGTRAAILVKGGHLDGEAVVDCLLVGGERVRFERPRIDGLRAHGAGCALSAAIAAALASGSDVVTAVRDAGDWLHDALRAARPVGRGATPPDVSVVPRRGGR